MSLEIANPQMFNVATHVRSLDGTIDTTTIFENVRDFKFDVAPVYADQNVSTDYEVSTQTSIVCHDFGVSGEAYSNDEGFYGYQIDHTENGGGGLEILLPHLTKAELLLMAQTFISSLKVMTTEDN